jgi:O-antigen/teichoic acid export membrane protein
MSGAVIARFSGLAASILVARILGRDGFGRLGIIQSTVAIFQVFAGFGLGLTATKYVSEFRTTNPQRAGRIIGFSYLVASIAGGAMSIILLLTAGVLARRSLAAPELAPILRLAAPMLLLSSINGSQIGALSGFEAFKDIARVNLIAGIATFPLMVIGTVAAGLTGATLALVGALLVNCAASYCFLRIQTRQHAVPVRYSGPHDWGLLWRFTVPALISGLMGAPVIWTCNALLVNSPGGYAAMGLFNAGSQWQAVLMFIPTLMMQAVLPIMSSAHVDGNTTSDFQRALRMTQSAMVTLAFPAATVMMFASGIIMRFYGRGFQNGAPVLIGVVASGLIQCIGAATGPAIQARGMMWTALLINASWAMTYIAFVYLTVARLGANALAYGGAVSYLVLTLWGFLYLERKLPLPPGTLKRVFLSVGFVPILVAGALICPAHLRLLLLVPVTALATVVTIMALADKDIIRSMLSPLPAQEAGPVPTVGVSS